MWLDGFRVIDNRIAWKDGFKIADVVFIENRIILAFEVMLPVFEGYSFL